jgi:hypothetical protein
MRRFGMLAIAAGVWVGGATHAQDVDPQAQGAVAGGVAAFGPPPPPPSEPAGPDLPVAVGISAGTATFLPGGGQPAGGSVPPSQGGGGAGGGGSGGSGGGGASTNPDGLPILPAQTPSLSDPDPAGPTPAEELPSVGGPQGLEVPNFFPPPPPPPLGAPLPPSGEDPAPTGPPPDGGTDSDPPSPPGSVAETPEPGTLLLAGIGAAAALGWRRRRRA